MLAEYEVVFGVDRDAALAQALKAPPHTSAASAVAEAVASSPAAEAVAKISALQPLEVALALAEFLFCLVSGVAPVAGATRLTPPVVLASPQLHTTTIDR